MIAKEFISEKHYVYGVFDSVDQLVYIGFTNDMARRIKEHERYSSNPRLRKIINNWGLLKYKIIAIFYDKNLAKEYEEILISKYSELLLNIKK